MGKLLYGAYVYRIAKWFYENFLDISYIGVSPQVKTAYFQQCFSISHLKGTWCLHIWNIFKYKETYQKLVNGMIYLFYTVLNYYTKW